LCEHAQSKIECAQILRYLTQNLHSKEAAQLAAIIARRPFFIEITGNMHEYRQELSHLSTLLEHAIQEQQIMIDEDTGEIIESDADSEGNLRYK
jgi:hypothetical protein